jgi:COP9 signalosome complex subunit 7
MDAVRSTAAQAETARTEHHQALLQNLTNAQHQLEAQQKKSKPNAMDLDEDSRTGARKKSTSSAARGNKRSRA